MEFIAVAIVIHAAVLLVTHWRAASGVDLERTADTILIDFYNSQAPHESEDALRNFAHVVYLDLCNRYGLPRAQAGRVADSVVKKWRPTRTAAAVDIFA